MKEYIEMTVFGCGKGGSSRGGAYDNGYSCNVQMGIDCSSDYSIYVETSNDYPPTYEEALKMKSVQQKESSGITFYNPTTNLQPSNRQQPRNVGSGCQEEYVDYYSYEQEPGEFQLVTCLPMIIVLILFLIIILWRIIFAS